MLRGTCIEAPDVVHVYVAISRSGVPHCAHRRLRQTWIVHEKLHIKTLAMPRAECLIHSRPVNMD